MMYINRAISEVLKKRVKASKCLLLTGARQVGKTTLIRHEFAKYNTISFDDNECYSSNDIYTNIFANKKFL